MKNKHERASSSLRMLEIVARKLDNLNDEIVYLGEPVIAPAIPPKESIWIKST